MLGNLGVIICLLVHSTENVNFGIFTLLLFWVMSTWIDTFGSSHCSEIFCVNSVSAALWTSTFMHVEGHWFLPLINIAGKVLGLNHIHSTLHYTDLLCLNPGAIRLSWNCPSGKWKPHKGLRASSNQTETPVRHSSCQGSWSVLDHGRTTCSDISKAYFNCMFFNTHTHLYICIY